MPQYPNYSDEPDEPAETKDSGKEKGGASTVALLPKSILEGKTFEVGDEVTLKITALRGDEVEVECAYEPEKPAEEEPPAEEPPAEGGEAPPAEAAVSEYAAFGE